MAEKYRVLAVGSHGEDVSRVHARLLDGGARLARDELAEGFFGASTRRAVAAFQERHGLPSTGAVDDATAQALTAETTHGGFAVVGQVIGPDGRAVPGITVRAFDRDLRSEQLLGAEDTDDEGYYLIPYTREQFAQTEKDSADVFVRAYLRDQVLTDPPVAETVFNAPDLVSITIRLTTTTPPQSTEYERVVTTVEPLIGDLGWAGLREDREHSDLTFLVGETALPAEQIEHAAVGHRLASQNGAPPYLYYALFATDTLVSARRWSTLTPRFHIGLSTPLRELHFDIVLLPEADIRASVERAVREFIVPRVLLDELDAALALLARDREQAEEYLRAARQEAIIGQVQDFLTSDARDRVLEILREDPMGDLGGILDRLRDAGGLIGDSFGGAEPSGTGRPGGPAAAAATRLSMADIVGDDAAVLAHLSTTHRIDSPADLHRLATLDRADWVAAIRAQTRDAPRRLSEAAVERQAATLMRTMESRFPAAAFAARLTRDPVALPQADLIAEVLAANPDFDLARGNAMQLFRRLDPARDEHDAQRRAAARAALESAQRIYKVAPSYTKTKALLDNGISSAGTIHSLGQKRFVNTAVSSGEFTETEAAQAYRSASDVHAASVVLAGQLAAASAATNIAALASAPAELESVIADFPNLKSLFSLGDMCECEDCRSVHGAAAYLVDVLQFLKNRLVVDTTTTPAVSVKGAKDELFSRRPDLGDTDLSCANTNTPIPYLDLVCELLEEAVAPDPGVAFAGTVATGIADTALVGALRAQGWPFTAASAVYGPDLAGAFVVRDKHAVARLTPDGGAWRIRRLRQTHGTEAEAGAAPEYVNAPAYTTLAASTFAFGLPFDLAHQETRRYFAQFDLDRADLMTLLRAGGVPPDAAIAAERLGLSDAQRELIVTPAPTGQQAIWNTPATPAADTLSNVGEFVTRAGVEYTDLLELVDIEWIDGGAGLFVRHLDNSCNLAAKEIAQLDDAALDRFHRFLRLRTATGWTSTTLDRAIRAAAVGAGTLDDQCVVRIARLRSLQTLLGLDTAALLDLLTPLSVTDPAGTYARVFLTRSAVGDIDAQFLPEAVAANEAAEAAVPGSGVTLSAHASYLGLALGTAPADTAALVSFAGNDPALTTASVSRAYAGARLVRALRLTVTDLAILLEVLGTDPLASLENLETVATAAALVRAAGMSPDRLRYLLRHTATDLTAFELPAAAVADLITTLDTAYAAAQQATASPFVSTAPPSENAAAVSTQLGLLPGLSTADQNTMRSLLTDEWTDTTLTEDAFVDATLAGFIDTTPVKTALAARAAAVAPKDVEQNAVLSTIASAVSGYLYRRAREAALLTAVAAALDIPEERAAVLLAHAHLKEPASLGAPIAGEVLLDDATTAAAVDAKQRAIRLLHTVVEATAGLELTDDVASWLLDNAGALGWLEWDALPYDGSMPVASYMDWARLQSFFDLAAALPPVANPADPASPFDLAGLFDLILAGGTIGDILDYAATLAGLDGPTLAALDTLLGLSSPDLSGYRDPSTLRRLFDAATMLRQLGLDLPGAAAVTKPVLTLTDAATMRSALKTRYADTQWLGVLKQVQDGLREQKRDALVSYLLAANPALRDSTDLYDHFLIDVEMAACMPTSRIVQAHATVQLFVLRCLMGLEPTSVASVGHDTGWKQWDWMANFRVWEANRKIFLFPENWIEPELLDDQSELFVELNNQLQQDALTDLAVENATIAYLESLDDIAHVDVMACYYETTTKTMHVFGRTKGGDPGVYYHREFQQERYWTPWEKVSVDITGDHLLAFERNGRLTLAWPIFTEEPDKDKQPPDVPDPSSLGGGKETSNPDKRWKIQLAVSERAAKLWKPTKVSQGYLATPFQQHLPASTEFNFFVWGSGPGQAVTCVGPGNFTGSFALTGCKGYPEPTSAGTLGSGLLLPVFKDTKLLANRFTEQNLDPTDELTIHDLLQLTGSLIASKTPGNFKITYPMQMSLLDWILLLLEVWAMSQSTGASLLHRQPGIPLGTLMPYFYGDFSRTYAIVPGFYERGGARREPVSEGSGYYRSTSVSATRTKKTFSDVLKLVEDLLALVAKYLQKLAEDPSQPVADLIEEFLADPETTRLWNEMQVYQTLRYGLSFENFYHPLVCLLRATLHRSGIPALMDRHLQLTDTGFDFDATYHPSPLVVSPYPREDLDFTLDGAYSAYNWELFFHLPFDIAKRLTKDQQFEAARDWYHYIFNPVGAADAPAPRKYWSTKPFFLMTAQEYLDQRIGSIMYAIAADPSGAAISDLAFAVSQWRDKPFRPHVVARSRHVAYQVSIVINYVRNLVEWGDFLFRQFTRESVTQATQMYVLAEKLLGRKPRVVPPVVTPPPMTYHQLEPDLDLFGNALLDLESLIPDLGLLPHEGEELPPAPATLTSLYFCIPPNENLLAMWDVVADRLLKIRHCRNIDGVQATLALFSPPIDPGALVRAVAAGMSISSFVAGLGAPLPHYRFSAMVRQATELTSQVASLGGELLSVLEKRDAEKIARLRAEHEVSLLDSVRQVKLATIAEAQGALEALKRSRDVIQRRHDFFSTQDYMNPWEITSVALSGLSLIGEAAVAIAYMLSGGLKLIPTFTVGGAGFGGSPLATVATGGQSAGGSAESAAAVISALTRVADKGAAMAATQGGFQRRQDDWDLQADLAAKELVAMDQQIANAQLHLDTLAKDLASHDKQASNAKQARHLMHSKYTNQELYEWMLGQISSVYYQAYQLAFDTAKKAERCYGYELGIDTTFIKFGYWDSLKKGLMSHQALLADIRRMETAYLQANKREYELTKHVSLAQLDPGALMMLRTTGKATIQIPELVFAMDHPSHYFRRIKTVAVSLVCNSGPYTTVAVQLSLVSNKYRKNTAERQGMTTDKEKYAEQLGSDTRFAYNVGSIASIATSTAVSDSGLFELNFHDDRYLPFEGAGAVSTWQVELPTVLGQIDFDTITDLVLHVRYTAREGGSTFRTLVEKSLVELSNEMLLTLGRQGWHAWFNVREQFPDEWWQLTSTGSTQLTIEPKHLPFLVREYSPTIATVLWAAQVTGSPVTFPITVDGTPMTLNRDTTMKALCVGPSSGVTLGTPVSVSADPANLEQLTLLVHYTIAG